MSMISPSRRNLRALLEQLRRDEPKDWPHHLHDAFATAAKHKAAEQAKTIVIESVKSAHRCGASISNILLSTSQADVSTSFHKACVRLANCLSPRRLPRDKVIALNAAARKAFIDDEIDTETISYFWLNCKEILGRPPRDKHSTQALRNLGVLEDPRFGELECKRRGAPTLPIVNWYNALPNDLRIELETGLCQLAQRRGHHLEAREVFVIFADLLSTQDSKASIEIKDLLAAYIHDVVKIWIDAGLPVGRSNNEDNPEKLGPFPSFLERVLLSQFDMQYNFFDRADVEQVWDVYEALPEEFKSMAEDLEKPTVRLVSDWQLRWVLKELRKKLPDSP
jgi:hypothetical protein